MDFFIRDNRNTSCTEAFEAKLCIHTCLTLLVEFPELHHKKIKKKLLKFIYDY